MCKGIVLPCPKCGEPSAIIKVSLANVDEFECAECGNEFAADEVRDFIARWQPVLAWLQTIPESAPAKE
jgi:Zn ribbon nucleic-acid-binding protein